MSPARADTKVCVVCVCVWLFPGESQTVIITLASHCNPAESPYVVMGCPKRPSHQRTGTSLASSCVDVRCVSTFREVHVRTLSSVCLALLQKDWLEVQIKTAEVKWICSISSFLFCFPNHTLSILFLRRSWTCCTCPGDCNLKRSKLNSWPRDRSVNLILLIKCDSLHLVSWYQTSHKSILDNGKRRNFVTRNGGNCYAWLWNLNRPQTVRVEFMLLTEHVHFAWVSGSLWGCFFFLF